MPVTNVASVALKEARKFGSKLWQVTRELWHQIIGFVFVSFAIMATFGAGGLIPTYQQMDRDPDNVWRIVMLLVFIVIFAGFGISSFRRARRVSRNR